MFSPFAVVHKLIKVFLHGLENVLVGSLNLLRKDGNLAI
jgi:hypothetical protein